MRNINAQGSAKISNSCRLKCHENNIYLEVSQFIENLHQYIIYSTYDKIHIHSYYDILDKNIELH